MPTVRRVSSVPPEDKEPSRRTVPQRGAVPRRRQAQQQLLQQRRAAAKTRPRDSEAGQEKESTPLLLKLLSWLGIVLLCFVIGYMGTSWLMEFLNRKLLLKPENRIENQEDLTEFQEAEHEKTTRLLLESGADIQQISLSLHYVQDDSIGETRKNFVSSTKEDNIRSAVEEVLELSEVPNAGRIKLLHVFRNGETAFLDMPGQFASALEDMGERKSQLLLTGLVRTLQENFAPVKQIRFLIDSQPPKSGGTVNLTAVWKMPPKS